MDRKIEKKVFTPKRVLSFSLATIFFGVVLYNLIWGDRSSKLNVDLERITVSEVSVGPFLEYITQPGNVIPLQTRIVTAVEGGRVEEKFIEAGAFVEVGDPIIRLENTDLLLNIMQRETNFTEQQNRIRGTLLNIEQNSIAVQREAIEMENALRTTKAEYERQKALYEKNATSKQIFENAEYQYNYILKRKELSEKSAKANAEFTEVQLTQMLASQKDMENNLAFVRKKLENLTVRAMISGQLTALDAELGQSMNMGAAIGQIDVLDGFKVQCNPDEHYINRIRVGLRGSFKLPNRSEEYHCNVTKVFPQVVGGAFRIWLNFDGNIPVGIRNGQTIRVNLELGSPLEATILDRGGFYSSTGGQWVYVIDPSGDFAIKRSVRIGRQNPRKFEILEGLEPGEKVITSSYDNFGDIDKLVLRGNND